MEIQNEKWKFLSAFFPHSALTYINRKHIARHTRENNITETKRFFLFNEHYRLSRAFSACLNADEGEKILLLFPLFLSSSRSLSTFIFLYHFYDCLAIGMMKKKYLDEDFQIKIGLRLSGKKREYKNCAKKKSSSSLTALSIYYSSGNKAEI